MSKDGGGTGGYKFPLKFQRFSSPLLNTQASSCFCICVFEKKLKRMDSCNTGFQAGQAKGQTQEKTSQFMDKASNAAQSAMESCQETGQQMKNKAQEAAETVKSKVGTDK